MTILTRKYLSCYQGNENIQTFFLSSNFLIPFISRNIQFEFQKIATVRDFLVFFATQCFYVENTTDNFIAIDEFFTLQISYDISIVLKHVMDFVLILSKKIIS